MQAIDFVVETLAHFVGRGDGPAPGIPAHADTEFEHEVAWLCEWHSLTPIVLASLEKLALRPSISRVALRRMKALADASRALSADLLRAALSLAAIFESRGVDHMFAGDVVLSSTVYPARDLRPLESIEVVIREGDYASALEGCREGGFGVHGRFPIFRSAEEALRYHQCYARCVLQTGGGDRLGLRMRLFDVGEPEETEIAWRRARRLSGDGLQMIGLEDQLIHSCMTYAMSDFDELLHASDIGLMVTRFGGEIDWSYIEGRLRARAAYPAVVFTLTSVLQWLRLREGSCRLARPGRLRRKLFDIVWHAAYDSFERRRQKRSHRVRFGLFEVGRWGEKLRFLIALLSPNREWVAAFFGRPYTPWLRVRFVVLALRNRIGLPSASNPSRRT